MAITVPALDATTDIVDTDMLLVTHSDGTSEKISGSEINKRSKIIIASTTTVTGTPLKTGNAVRIYFTADVTGSDTTTTLQINYNNTNYNVKVPRNGALENFVAFNLGGSPAVYKYLQAYTTLELLFDGTNFVIDGNPLVLSGTDYSIFADGLKRVNAVTANDKGMVTSGAVKSVVDTKADYADLAPVFSTSTAYEVGQYVIYNGNLYVCTFAHSAGAWNPLHFTVVTIGNELAKVNTNLFGFSKRNLSAIGWYKIAEFGVRNFAQTVIIDLTRSYSNSEPEAHHIILEYSWLNCALFEMADSPKKLFTDIKFCWNSNNIDVMAVYVKYNSNLLNECKVRVNGLTHGSSFTVFNFIEDELTWGNTISYTLGKSGFFINGEERIPSAPSSDGTYNLQCTVSSGVPTYSWVSTGNRSLPEPDPSGEDER